MSINPFFELYVGEKLSSREFVNIFSPFLVEYAEPLFLPGNIVVKGVQGSGKSMLLSLLKPNVQMEYARAETEFPVCPKNRRFIGAGINLSHSNALDFGYRPISPDHNTTALFFADFINYAILFNLFDSIDILARRPHTHQGYPRIDFSEEREYNFIAALATADDFQGTLEACQNAEDVQNCIRKRLNAYRRYLHCNVKEIDGQIRESKTDIGVPLSKTATLLKQSGIIEHDVSIFIHIDQYEELVNIPPDEKNSPDYRRVINRALARRDPTISYRIGTRGHAWGDHRFIFGSNARLEEERDYKYVDLDLILRRHENPETWVFPGFVRDVFARRLAHAGFGLNTTQNQNLLERVFGKGLLAKEKAKRYGGSNPARIIKVDPNWPANFKKKIVALAEEDPLSARLLEAWVLQKIDQSVDPKKGSPLIKPDFKMFSEMNEKVWWKKERIDLALIQIAGKCQQRPLWSGYSEIIELSGGNILTFLSICQFIWSTQSQIGRENTSPTDLNEIKPEIQAIGIFKASNHWFNKITPETGRSEERLRLTRQIGNVLGRKLYADRKMSYPGHNGFSLTNSELENFPHVKSLLEEMCDYGTLIDSVHTTKEKDRQSRRKFYLNPILCPQFKMPYKRLKEPYYIRPTTVEDWMYEAGLQVSSHHQLRAARTKTQNLPLFDEGEDL